MGSRGPLQSGNLASPLALGCAGALCAGVGCVRVDAGAMPGVALSGTVSRPPVGPRVVGVL